MTEFWNKRYSAKEYAYGKEPNVFLKETLQKLKPSGKALFPGEGEGRNSVFAAQLGLDVFAFDTSKQAREKALTLAAERGVSIHYEVGTFPQLHLATQTYAVIALIYVHLPPPVLAEYHQKFTELLQPGGYLILEGFSKNNLSYRTQNPQVGGPSDPNLLFTPEGIKKSFPGLDVLQLEEKVIELQEGAYHKGTASVVRYIGQKPE